MHRKKTIQRFLVFLFSRDNILNCISYSAYVALKYFENLGAVSCSLSIPIRKDQRLRHGLICTVQSIIEAPSCSSPCLLVRFGLGPGCSPFQFEVQALR